MSTFTVTSKNLPLVLTRRAKLIGLPTSITNPIIRDFSRWYRCSGPDWAVARMKVIKQVILNTASGKPGFPEDSWISHRGNKFPRGPYRDLMVRALSSDRQLKKALCFLNLYSVCTHESETEEIVQKFRRTVEAPGPVVPDVLHRAISKIAGYLGKRYGNPEPISYAPAYERSPKGKLHQEAEFLDVVERSFRTPAGRRIISTYPCVFTPMMNVMGFRGYRYSDGPEVMGRVFRIPSPGLKDRWVCDFNKAFDYCLKPMGKWVYDLVSRLPWDITFDESKCYHAIQARLRSSRCVYSFDLSSATDRFPWSLQLDALRSVNPDEKFQEMVTLYDDLIKMPALMPDGSLVRWTQGQPLGAYPSFATFTFTHGALLFALNGSRYNGEFFVHGDDLVVMDKELAENYSKVIRSLGVELSTFKTLQSTKIAEINSKVITAEHVLSVPKWKPISRSNALGQIKNWGPDVTKFLKLSEEETNAILRMASLPVCLGGSGVNPLGLSLEKRMEGLGDILFKDKELSYEGSSRRKVLDRYLRNPNFFELLGDALRDADSADQADLANVPYKVYGDYRDLDLMAANTYSVNPDLGRAIDQGPPRRRQPDEVRRTVAQIRKISSFTKPEEDG